MTPAELRAVGRLGGLAVSGLVARIEQVHQVIADRAFAPAGLAGAPARLIHDGVARGAYLALRGAGVAAGTVGGAAGFVLSAGGQPVGGEPRGNLALAVLNAVAGDRLGADLAPLARVAGLASWALGRVPETRPFAALVAGPASVKDLRYGYVLDDDWVDCDQDRCLRDHRSDAPLLAAANHYAISATVTANPASPLGTVIGDLLVQPASAHGHRGPHPHIPFPVETGRRLGAVHHFDLLNHPEVWRTMSGLLRQTVR